MSWFAKPSAAKHHPRGGPVWRAGAIAGLADLKRPGRPKTGEPGQDHQCDVDAATSLGVTHWSSRLLAPQLAVDHSTNQPAVIRLVAVLDDIHHEWRYPTVATHPRLPWPSSTPPAVMEQSKGNPSALMHSHRE
jgi:hypothetical protein